MGKKPDFLTPKAISNRIKARGLQKLRWYCQLCQKQCRDENGFKCHQTSASHRRQMELFGQNPGQMVAQYSHQFERDFMAHMRVCHPNAQVSANRVYNEFIRDKDHVHMNSTRWLSLSGFVQYLAKKGLVRIEKGPRGWLMQMIPKDSEEDLTRKKRNRRDGSEKLDEERQLKDIERQIKKAKGNVDREEDEQPIELSREGDDQPIAFCVTKATEEETMEEHRPALEVFGDEGEMPSAENEGHVEKSKRRGISHLESIHATFKKSKPSTSHSWIRPGIVVKVLSLALKAHGYYKQKGIIKRLIDPFVAELEMIESHDIVRVDQLELETVLPAIGGKVQILKGRHEDAVAEVTDVNVERFIVEVSLLTGSRIGRKEWFAYEDVSKIYNQQH